MTHCGSSGVSQVLDAPDLVLVVAALGDSGPGCSPDKRPNASDGRIGVVAADAGVMLGTKAPASGEGTTETTSQAAVALAGVVSFKVDTDYGSIWPGDLLVTSPTAGHAMRTDAPLPETMLGKALEPLEDGTGTIEILVMLL